MSTIASVNPGVSDLLNFLSSTGSSPVSSVLSSPSVQTALHSSSPGDLAQLSQQALQLQQAGSLFGNSDSAETSATPESLLLQALTSSTTGTSTSSTSTAGAATSALALQQAYQLFGTNPNSGTGSGSYSFVG